MVLLSAGSDVADLPPENAIDPSGFGEETSTAGLTVYSADTNLFTGGQAGEAGVLPLAHIRTNSQS